ncbi:hypothetical protein CONCODRAFT_19763 [Conidiobolus coronatus NRRL 28638]|uniref:Uncharacterized protein n=1 Tax=Conidiobolus coronatus (strain ATCC 28846 / CBS 209.66 / NRRL 28638) TaxID=796925 RepID=A0A137NX18_CONC2|nr:hypothetical protein CONCODRAFT_19763 [Conidiobolus coronatus NRRL 28638]|eukprot:KXN67238.1 hypothetical protein CONCODRAFT_19763 [Conidiobolus coronatus NRRL 28638]
MHTLPRYFNKDTAKELNSNKKLIKLKLGMFYHQTETPTTIYTTINSVTNLDINLDRNGANYFEEACKLFPNVETLHFFSKLTNLTLKSKKEYLQLCSNFLI